MIQRTALYAGLLMSSMAAASVAASHPAMQESAGDQEAVARAVSEADETARSGAAPSNAQEAARLLEFFAIADHDGNGWISYREARESLDVDRLTYSAFDADRDGRVRLAEFEERLAYIEERGGFVRAPRPSEGPVLLPTRNSEQLRNAFDTNADGALEEFEIDQLLATYRRHDVPTRIVIEKLDTNNSKKLELDELTSLSQLLSTTYSELDERAARPSQDLSIDALFGGLTEPTIVEYQRTQSPPRIGGPVRPFRRLDLDGNGEVSIEELERLQRPLTLEVRIGAVLAALDADGNGTLSSDEFAGALD